MAIDPLQMYNGGDFRGQVMRHDPPAAARPGLDPGPAVPGQLPDVRGRRQPAGPPRPARPGHGDPAQRRRHAGRAVQRSASSSRRPRWPCGCSRAPGTTWSTTPTRSWPGSSGRFPRSCPGSRSRRSSSGSPSPTTWKKQMMAAQLMMSQQLSGTTVLGDLGYNWKKEQKQIADEARYQAELQSRTQEEMQQAGFAQQIAKGQGGDPSQGGGGPRPGRGQGGGRRPGGRGGMGTQGCRGRSASTWPACRPNVPQTPQDMMQVADSSPRSCWACPSRSRTASCGSSSSTTRPCTPGQGPHGPDPPRTPRPRPATPAMGQQQQGGGGQPAAT
jgi:hypothetical protein